MRASLIDHTGDTEANTGTASCLLSHPTFHTVERAVLSVHLSHTCSPSCELDDSAAQWNGDPFSAVTAGQ